MTASYQPGGKILAVDYALPDPVYDFGGGANTIVTAINVYAVPATFPASVTIANPHATRSMLCWVRFGAWVVANGAEVRVALEATGSNVWSAGSAGPGGTVGPYGYSESLIVVGDQGVARSVSRECTFSMEVPAAGSTTLEVRTSRSIAAGTNQCNYPTVRAVPIRFM